MDLRSTQIVDASNSSPSLKKGSKGQGVQILQAALIDLGYRMPDSTRKTDKPGGLYGKETSDVVAEFQKKNGLKQDGIAGRRTDAILDERIAAANVVGFMSTVRPMMRAHIDTHSWVHFPPSIHRYLDLPDVVSMMAPKPLLVQQCTHDGLYPLSGMKDAVKKIGAIYEKVEAAENFSGRFYDTAHRFTRDMQADAFAFFDQHLK